MALVDPCLLSGLASRTKCTALCHHSKTHRPRSNVRGHRGRGRIDIAPTIPPLSSRYMLQSACTVSIQIIWVQNTE
jgi:hypothetical protein